MPLTLDKAPHSVVAGVILDILHDSEGEATVRGIQQDLLFGDDVLFAETDAALQELVTAGRIRLVTHLGHRSAPLLVWAQVVR